MLRRNLRTDQRGFTLVELTTVMIVVVLAAITMYGFFSSSFARYFNLQKDSTNLSELSVQSQRVANVLRGSTDVISVANNELSVYAYFAPADTYVSQIRYYRSADNKILYADVTRMTANPPIGTPIPSTLKTYTIISDFHQGAGINLFTYLDASGNALTTPISDLKTIKGIRVTLTSPSSTPNVDHTTSVQVSLRNRKTNL